MGAFIATMQERRRQYLAEHYLLGTHEPARAANHHNRLPTDGSGECRHSSTPSVAKKFSSALVVWPRIASLCGVASQLRRWCAM